MKTIMTPVLDYDDAKIGDIVTFTRRGRRPGEDRQYRGVVIDKYSYDNDEYAEYREVLVVRCDDGQIRKPVLAGASVYRIDN